MENYWLVKLILLLLLFCLSAFFSGSEVALYSLDRRKLKTNFRSSALIYKYVASLLNAPKRLLVTILIGNTIVNVGASIIGVLLAIDYSEYSGISLQVILPLQIIILTILIILFGELLPKVWALKNPVSYSTFAAVPLYWMSIIIYPVSETITEMMKSFSGRFDLAKQKAPIHADDIQELANIGLERGTLEDEEQGIINSLVIFKNVTVNEVMTPRVDMVSVPLGSSYDDFLNIVTSTGHSRLPLFHNDLDKVVGVIYAKDALKYLNKNLASSYNSLSDIAREPMFVPKSKLISTLLSEFQEKKMHIAIVVDEYGGTAGLVTLEDIIEEVIGEIRDEYDREENKITDLGHGRFLLLGKLSIDELQDLIGVNLSSDEFEFETVGGFVLHQSGIIPKSGYSLDYEGYRFTVKEVHKKRINSILIEKIS